MKDQFTTLKRFSATAAVMAITRTDGFGRRECLLVQRKKGLGKGLWSLPGGRRTLSKIRSRFFPHPTTGHRVLIFNIHFGWDDPRRSKPLYSGKGTFALFWFTETQASQLALTPLAKEVVPFFIS